MKLRDESALVLSKLKVRKLRTAATIISASCLFGVIVAAFVVMEGFFGNIANLAEDTFGSDVVLVEDSWGDDTEVIERALELYEESQDPNKQYPVIQPEIDPARGYAAPPYLDASNPFAIEATTTLSEERTQKNKARVTEQVDSYGGKIIATSYRYCVRGDLFIEGLTPADELDLLRCYMPGEAITVMDGDILSRFIKIRNKKDDAIQVIMPLDYAAQIVGIDKPSPFGLDPAALQSYVGLTNQRAIGHRFAGVAISGSQESEIVYEIVGLLPTVRATAIDNNSINPIELALRELVESTSSRPQPIIVTNPDSAAFRSFYDLDSSGGSVYASFDGVESADAFLSDPGRDTIPEFVGNQSAVYADSVSINRGLVAAVGFFAVIAGVVMAATVGRVMDDERQAIALYRAVGATSRNILQIFAGYILVLCLLIIVCATVIGIAIAGAVTIINTGTITANISALYNIPDLAPVLLIGFDPRILLVYLAIVVVGFACLLLIVGKLKSKAIVADLRG